jgi:effector-binding domain-containing protein
MPTTIQSEDQCELKTLPPMLIAAVRMQARYDECGKGFGKIARKFWRQLSGKPFLLCHDACYQEIANYEVCFPIKKGESDAGIEVRELSGGRCVSLLHKGPYDQLKHSYQQIRDYVRQRGLRTLIPSREVYLKGPGMIFRGNPKYYLTEIQIMIES